MKKAIQLFTFLVIILGLNLTLSAQKNSSTDLKASIAGLSGGNISKDIILNSSEILCSNPAFEIISFTLSVSKDNDIIDFYGTGKNLTVQMKDLIKGMSNGNKIIIEKISAKTESGKVTDLPAIVLVLK